MSTKTHYEKGTLTVTRIFDAPREDVFDAWIETSKVELWWGCADTTKVKSQIEPRVGGKYFHLMTIKDGGDFPSDGLITAFDPPAKLAYTVNGPEPGPGMSVTVEFSSLGDQTEVRLTHSGLPDELSEIVAGGWSAAFGKLDLFLIEDAEAA